MCNLLRQMLVSGASWCAVIAPYVNRPSIATLTVSPVENTCSVCKCSAIRVVQYQHYHCSRQLALVAVDNSTCLTLCSGERTKITTRCSVQSHSMESLSARSLSAGLLHTTPRTADQSISWRRCSPLLELVKCSRDRIGGTIKEGRRGMMISGMSKVKTHACVYLD